jgi:hypothetical protein
MLRKEAGKAAKESLETGHPEKGRVDMPLGLQEEPKIAKVSCSSGCKVRGFDD